jgi:hypothetical protein
MCTVKKITICKSIRCRRVSIWRWRRGHYITGQINSTATNKMWKNNNNFLFFLTSIFFYIKNAIVFFNTSRSLLILSFSLYLHEHKCSQRPKKSFLFTIMRNKSCNCWLYIYMRIVNFIFTLLLQRDIFFLSQSLISVTRKHTIFF